MSEGEPAAAAERWATGKAGARRRWTPVLAGVLALVGVVAGVGVASEVAAQEGISWAKVQIDAVDTSGSGNIVQHVQVNSTLMACEKVPGGAVRFWKSVDLGATWNAPVTITTAADTAYCSIAAVTENHAVIAYKKTPVSQSRMDVARTSDGGASWTVATSADPASAGQPGNLPYVVYETPTRVLAVNAALGLAAQTQIRFCDSDDRGATWACATITESYACEVSSAGRLVLVVKSAGNYWLHVRCNELHAFTDQTAGVLVRYKSDDSGASWDTLGHWACGQLDENDMGDPYECRQFEAAAFTTVGNTSYATTLRDAQGRDGAPEIPNAEFIEAFVWQAVGDGNWTQVGVAWECHRQPGDCNQDFGDFQIAANPNGVLLWVRWELGSVGVDPDDFNDVRFVTSINGGTTWSGNQTVDAISRGCSAVNSALGCLSIIGLTSGAFSIFASADEGHFYYSSDVISVANHTRCCFEFGRGVAFGFDTDAKSLHVQDHERLYRFNVDTPGYPDDVDTVVVTETAVGDNCAGNPLMDGTGQTFAGPSINALAVTSEGANVGRAIAMCNNLGGGEPDYVVLYDQALEGSIAWPVESNPNSVSHIDARTANDVIYAGENLPESALGWLVSLDLPALEKDWEVDTQEQIVDVAFDLLRADEVWVTTDEGTRMYRVATGLKGFASPVHAMGQVAVGNRTVYLTDAGDEAVIRQYTFNGAALVAGAVIDTGFEAVTQIKSSKDGQYVMAWDGNTFKVYNKTGLEPLVVGSTATQIVELDMDLVNRYLAVLDQDILYVYNVFQKTTSLGGEGNKSFNLPPDADENPFNDDESVDPGPDPSPVGGGAGGWFGTTTLDGIAGFTGASRGEVGGILAIILILMGAGMGWRLTHNGVVAGVGGLCGLVLGVAASLVLEWVVALVGIGAVAFIMYHRRG